MPLQLMYEPLTSAEIDVQIAGTRLFDYLIDGLITAAQDSVVERRLVDYRGKARILFGEAVVELARAIHTASENEEQP